MLHSLYGGLPHLVDVVPPWVGIQGDGFNSGQVGGTLALLFPSFWPCALFQRTWWKRVILMGVSVLVLTTLLLAASRAASLGIAFGTMLVVVLVGPACLLDYQ